MSKFDGDYNILSVDSNYYSLDYAFTYVSLLASKKQPTKNAYINLKAIDDKHIKAILFANDAIVKSKTIKGRLINNYFEFHTSHLKFRFLINLYAQQSNRLTLSKEGDLYLDTNRGGIGFFIILPIPLSGSSFDTYNLKFIRRNKANSID